MGELVGMVGTAEGAVGIKEGESVGILVGLAEGTVEGGCVGALVGEFVARSVDSWQNCLRRTCGD